MRGPLPACVRSASSLALCGVRRVCGPLFACVRSASARARLTRSPRRLIDDDAAAPACRLLVARRSLAVCRTWPAGCCPVVCGAWWDWGCPDARPARCARDGLAGFGLVSATRAAASRPRPPCDGPAHPHPRQGAKDAGPWCSRWSLCKGALVRPAERRPAGGSRVAPARDRRVLHEHVSGAYGACLRRRGLCGRLRVPTSSAGPCGGSLGWVRPRGCSRGQ